MQLYHFGRVAGLLLLATIVLCFDGRLVAQDDPASFPESPKIAAASDEGEMALTTFKYPDGWSAELWAAEPLLANPVVFTIDSQGRVWVCESYRQDRGVTDNRSHDSNWLDHDLAAQTVADRIAYHKKLLPDAGIEYTRYDDLIRVLEDRSGDGKADKSWVFADHFNDLEMGTGAGVLVRGNDVYYACIPDLWMLKDTDGDGASDSRRSLSKGYGVKVAFRGHDSHGLIVGPDGRLYFSIGDRGYSIELPDGRRLHDPESGAVFRCELDGSNLEVFATGLRNPQELAFDDYGNLFTGDNNSDSGDKARWVYVAEGGDSGWRMHYQYMPDRGPFNREKIWHPYHKEQPAFIVPPVINISDGPSGLAYYPGTGLSDQFNGCFFLCDFRGASAVSGIRTFRAKPKGAFFELVDSEQPIWQILATDLEFGPDGYVYISDWVNGWSGEGKGRIYRFSDPVARESEVVKEVQQLLRNGLGDTPIFRLLELMNHQDRRIRQLAQFEMVERKLDDELQKLLVSESPLMGRIHSLWGIGQRIRSGEADELKPVVVKQLGSDNEELRAQAAKLIGDLNIDAGEKRLIGLLDDTSVRVRYFAAISLGKQQVADAIGPLVQMLDVNDGEDPAIRHAAIMGLAGQADFVATDAAPASIRSKDLFAVARESKSIEVQRALAVVFRKRKSPRLREFLEFATDSLVLDEVARAIYDVPVSPAMADLAAQLDGKLNEYSDHFLRRALGAANSLGGDQNAQRIARLSVDPNASIAMRNEAIDIMANWADPTSRDRVIGHWRPIGTRSADTAIAAIEKVFAKIVAEPKTRLAGIDAAKRLKLLSAGEALQKLFSDPESDEQTRMNVLLALSELETDNLRQLCQMAADDRSAKLRMASREVSIAKSFEVVDTASFWSSALRSEDLRERQHAYKLLASASVIGKPIPSRAVESRLQELLQGKIPKTDRLDLMDAAEAWKNVGQIGQLIQTYRMRFDQEDPVSRNRDTLFGGDAERGSDIFWNRTSVYCQRCHQIGNGGGAVGPNLSDIALTKDREYLLESIVNPNKTIAENFETTIILDLDGNTISGIVQKETDKFVQLIDVDAKIITVQKDNIEGRKRGQSAMPIDLVKHLSQKDIRDVIEFLAQQKTKPKEGTVVIPEGNK